MFAKCKTRVSSGTSSKGGNQHCSCERARPSVSLTSCIPHVPSPPASPFSLISSPEAPHFLSRSNPPLDMLPLCSATLTCRLVPLLRGQPRCAGDNGMNAGMINPRGCWEKTQECVNQGDNTLFSRASVGGAGIMVLQAGFADLQPLSAG